MRPLVPPPLVALVCAGGMWVLARFVPGPRFSFPLQDPAGWAFGGIGLLFAFSAVFAFLKARTTVNPHALDQASSLVTSGPFALSRNPMYLGLVLILTALGVWWGASSALIGPVAFVAYITVFQIGPEERVMREKFGDSYVAYCKRVRRWI